MHPQEANAPFIIHQAAVSAYLWQRLAVHLSLFGLREDPLDECLVQQSERWSHGASSL
jgi:hypothetical protein